MRVVEVDDVADPRLTDYTSLTDVALRRVREPAEGLFMAESSKVLERALAAGHVPRSAFVIRRWLGEAERLLAEHAVDVFVADDDVVATVTGFTVHRGVLASMHRTPLLDVAHLLSALDPARPRRLLVLEDFTDHTNVGAAFRSAAALGVDAVLVTPRCADPLYRRSVRVSMGTVFQVPWTRIEPWPGSVEVLQHLGFSVAGLALADDAITLDELVALDPPALAMVLGNEGDGLTPRTLELVDHVVRIPMGGGVDSLNVAAATAVALYATRPPG